MIPLPFGDLGDAEEFRPGGRPVRDELRPWPAPARPPPPLPPGRPAAPPARTSSPRHSRTAREPGPLPAAGVTAWSHPARIHAGGAPSGKPDDLRQPHAPTPLAEQSVGARRRLHR